MSQHLSKKQFAQHMENNKAKFYRLAFCYVKNEHDALEIISEATYKGFINLGKLENPEFFDTWMSRIIINCAYDLLKKQKKFFRMMLRRVTENPRKALFYKGFRPVLQLCKKN